MLTSLSFIRKAGLKRLKFSALFILSPLFFYGQSLTGLWTGVLSNDSTTVRKDQSFEIALTEYKGKVYGYSCSEFIVNDTLYYIIKRVKGTIDEDICEVVDDEILTYNFRGRLDKGVKVTSTFRRNNNDSAWHLDGSWKTNITKKYYAITGKVGLKEEKDLASSRLFPHLEELNLAKDVAFYNERAEQQIVARIVKPEKIIAEYNDRSTPVINKTDAVAISIKAPAEPALEIVNNEPPLELHDIKSAVADLDKTNKININDNTVKTNSLVINKPTLETKKPEVEITSPDTNTIVSINKPEEKKIIQPESKPEKVITTPVIKTIVKQDKPVIVKNTAPPVTKKPDITINKPEIKPTVTTAPLPEKQMPVLVSSSITPEVKKSDADIIAKASVIEGRKSEFSQIVNFKSDSLEFSLYDNGEIDGDTVSIFMNGEVIMAKQGLKASAIKKTIYITPGNEDFTLVLFAENLGKYPPNTGLLVVHDGDEVYNLRFSSDLQKSAGIVFRRKK